MWKLKMSKIYIYKLFIEDFNGVFILLYGIKIIFVNRFYIFM